jgi:hypothetical protein
LYVGADVGEVYVIYKPVLLALPLTTVDEMETYPPSLIDDT